jgi:hypothetical protein
MVSCSLQKQHREHPFHCLLTRLSLVRITPFLRYQRKILIFNAILAFHVQQFISIPIFKTKSLYMFFTEKFLLAIQMKKSLRSLRLTIRMLPARLSHLSQFPPTKARLKETFSGAVLSTWAIYTAGNRGFDVRLGCTTKPQKHAAKILCVCLVKRLCRASSIEAHGK